MTRVSAIWFPKQEVVLYMQAKDLTKLQMEWCHFPSMSLGPRLLPVSPDSALSTFPALPACHTLPGLQICAHAILLLGHCPLSHPRLTPSHPLGPRLVL